MGGVPVNAVAGLAVVEGRLANEPPGELGARLLGQVAGRVARGVPPSAPRRYAPVPEVGHAIQAGRAIVRALTCALPNTVPVQYSRTATGGRHVATTYTNARPIFSLLRRSYGKQGDDVDSSAARATIWPSSLDELQSLVESVRYDAIPECGSALSALERACEGNGEAVPRAHLVPR